MFAGLPATGIGGIFYMVLVFFMPLKELWRAMKGESSMERWAFIASRWGLFAIVIAMMWLQGAIMKWAMGADMSKFMAAGASAATGHRTTSLAGATLYLALISLVGVMALVYIVRAVIVIRSALGSR
ncbi:MAG: hypothetical protein KF805_04525 [Phycisphaeraceae bacterium]|nr:hypothetical protein [Phycisphaeraceae bacterium]